MTIDFQKKLRWIPFVNLVTVLCAVILLIKKRLFIFPAKPFVKCLAIFALLTLPGTFVEYFFYKEWLWNVVFYVCFYFQLLAISTSGIELQQELLKKEEKKKKEETVPKEICKPKGAFLPRYGNYSLKKYDGWTYLIIVYISISILQKRIDISELIFSLVLLILQRFITHGEYYKIKERAIVIKKYFFQKTISLPDDMILIIAAANTLSFPYRRYQRRQNVIWIDNCYMVCLVSNCKIREAMNLMRWNSFIKDERYSNVIVREIFLDNFYSDFLYSFVFDPQQVQKLAANHNCQIILPKSLEGKVDLSGLDIPIHVDEEG